MKWLKFSDEEIDGIIKSIEEEIKDLVSEIKPYYDEKISRHLTKAAEIHESEERTAYTRAAEAYYHFGTLKIFSGDLEGAVKVSKKALELNPEDERHKERLNKLLTNPSILLEATTNIVREYFESTGATSYLVRLNELLTKQNRLISYPI